MKTCNPLIFCLILGALSASACAGATPASPTATNVPPTAIPVPDYAVLVEEFLAALNDHATETAAGFLADDAIFVWHLRFQRHTHPEPFEGRDSILEFWDSDAWTAVQVEAEDIETEDGRAVMKCRFFSGEAMISYGSPSSNSACVIIFEEGQITFIGDQANEQLELGG